MQEAIQLTVQAEEAPLPLLLFGSQRLRFYLYEHHGPYQHIETSTIKGIRKTIALVDRSCGFIGIMMVKIIFKTIWRGEVSGWLRYVTT